MRRSPFLLEVFSEIPEKPSGGIWSISFLYPLDGSVEYRAEGVRLVGQDISSQNICVRVAMKKGIARRAPGYQFECTCVARVPKV